MSALRVALDGPGSSGKSSVGATAAARLGYRFLDTGVLYRAIAWLSAQRDIDPEDEAGLQRLVPELELLPDELGRVQRVRVGGADITGELHAPEVDRRVSAVSRQPEVRAALLETQRDMAASGRIIVAGRDIGTVVLPDAELKLYLDVSVEERARRRAAERDLAPTSEPATAILEDLRRRDHLDSSRAVAPLRVPEDAVIVRSEGQSFEATVAEVVRIIRAHEAPDGVDPEVPRAPTRRVRPLPWYPRLVAALCRLGLGAIARIRIEGLADLPVSGPLIIAANHMSNADPPLIGGWLAPALGRRPTFLAKESLFGGPLGLIIRSLGAEPVRAGGSDISAYRAAKAILDRGGVVAILPEGTRSYDGVMGQPKPGVSLLATRTGAPVLPVGISGTDVLLGRDQRLPRVGARVTMRVGRPFRLGHPETSDRRAAFAAADTELMRRIAALVEPRHRGPWEPWPTDRPAAVDEAASSR